MKSCALFLILYSVMIIFSCGKNPTKGTNDSTDDGDLKNSHTVELPAGCPIALTDLKAITYLGDSPVNSDGNFSMDQSDSGPAMSFLVDSSDRLILLGYLDTSNQSAGMINAKSTAVGLLFRATGAFMLPPLAWKQAIYIIENSPQADTLADIIMRELVTHPTAIYNGNESIETALAKAAGELTGFVSKEIILKTVDMGKTDALTEDQPTLTLINPTARQSGVRVMANPEGQGIVIQNEYRRHLYYYIYCVGYKYPDNEPWYFTSWQPIAQRVWLQSVNDLNGFLGSLSDCLRGDVAWKPVLTNPIVLPYEPSDADKVFFKVLTIGPSLSDGLVLPEEYSKSMYSNYLKDSNAVDAFQVVFEFYIPIICSFLPADKIAKLKLDPKLVTASLTLYQDVANASGDLATCIAAKDFEAIPSVLAHSIADSDKLRTIFLKWLEDNEVFNILKFANMAEISLFTANKANCYLNAIDKLFAGLDIGKVISDVSTSHAYDQWDVTVIKPNVRVQSYPSNSVSLINSTTLLCTTSISDSEGPKRYEWSTDSGGFGHFIYEGENRGTAFNSSRNTCSFIAHDANAVDGQTQNVMVKVFFTQGDDIELGSAETILRYSKSSIEIQPDPAIVSNCGIITLQALVDGQSGTGLYNFHWSTEGESAILDDFTMDHRGRDFWTTDSSVNFIALNDLPPSMDQIVRVEARLKSETDTPGLTDDLAIRFEEAEIICKPEIFYHPPYGWLPCWQEDRTFNVTIEGYGFYGPWGPNLRYHWYTSDPFRIRIISDNELKTDIWTRYNTVCIQPVTGFELKEGDCMSVTADVFVIDEDGIEYGMVGSGKIDVITAMPIGEYYVGGNPECTEGVTLSNCGLSMLVNGDSVNNLSDGFWRFSAQMGGSLRFEVYLANAPLNEVEASLSIGPIYLRKSLWVDGSPSQYIQIFDGANIIGHINEIAWSKDLIIPF